MTKNIRHHLVEYHADRLTDAYENELDTFPGILSDMRSDTNVRQQELAAIAKKFLGRSNKSDSRKTSLRRIESRYISKIDLAAKLNAMKDRTAA